MCETWLKTTMQPPVVGTFSPPRHERVVVASSVGFTTDTARLYAQPRGCCRSRTVTREGYSVPDAPERLEGSDRGRPVARRAAAGQAPRAGQDAAGRPAPRPARRRVR